MRINEDFLDAVENDDITIASDNIKSEAYPFAIIFGSHNEYIDVASRMFLHSLVKEYFKFKKMLDNCKLDYLADDWIYVQQDSLVERFPDACRVFSPEFYNKVGDNKGKDYCGFIIYINKIKRPIDLLNIYFYGDYFLDNNEILKGRFYLYDMKHQEIIKKSWGGFLMPSVCIMREVWIKFFYNTCIVEYKMLEKYIAFEDFVRVCMKFFDLHSNLLEPNEQLKNKYQEH